MRRRTAAIALALACLVSTLTPCVARAEGAPTLSLTSDKESYAAGETATLTLAVTNGASQEMKGVEYSLELPEGMSASDDQPVSGSLGAIPAGEKREITLYAKVLGEAGEIVDDDPTEEGPTDKNPAEERPTEEAPGADASSPEAVPETGEGPWAAALAVALCGGGVAALLASKRVRKSALVAILGLGLVMSTSFAGATTARAAEAQSTLLATCNLQLPGGKSSVSARVSYLMSTEEEPDEEEPSQPDDPGSDTYLNVELQDHVVEIEDYQVVDGGFVVSEEVFRKALEERNERLERAGSVDAGVTTAAYEAPKVAARSRAAANDKPDFEFSGPVCIAFDATDENPMGNVGVLGELSYWVRPDFHDPMLFLKVSQADDPRDVFEKIDVVGLYENSKVSDVDGADGVEVLSVSSAGEISLGVKADDGDGNAISGTISLKPIVDCDVHWSAGTFNGCRFAVGIEGSIQGKVDVGGYGDEFDLFKRPFVIHLGNSINVACNVAVSYGIDGQADFEITHLSMAGVERVDNNWQGIQDSETYFKKAELAAEASVGVQPYGMIRVLSVDLIDVGFRVTLSASSTIEIHDPDEEHPKMVRCTDLKVSLGGAVTVGDQTEWMKEVGLSLGSINVNWPLNAGNHWEAELDEDGDWGKDVETGTCTFDREDVSGDRGVTADGFVYEGTKSGYKIVGVEGEDAAYVTFPAKIKKQPVVAIDLKTSEYENEKLWEVRFEDGNELKSFSIASVDGVLSSLRFIYFDNTPEIETIEMEKLPIVRAITIEGTSKLKEFAAKDCSLPVVDFSSCGDLEKIDLTSSSADLVLGYHPNLTSIGGEGAGIGSVDLTGCPNLQVLEATLHGEIDLTGCPELRVLRGTWRDAEHLDFSGNPKLEEISIPDSYEVASIDFGGASEIPVRILDIERSDVSLLPTERMYHLQTLNCSYTNVTALDMSNCFGLTELTCGNQKLSAPMTTLIIDKCPLLKTLNCYYSHVGELNLSGNPALEALYCAGCDLTELDISACINLRELVADNNPLTALDISSNTALEEITVEDDYMDKESLRSLYDWGSQPGHNLVVF